MLIRIVVCTVLAVGATSLAPAEITRTTAFSATLRSVIGPEDDMAHFLTLVEDIAVQTGPSANANRPHIARDDIYSRHVGFGFAHDHGDPSPSE